MVDLPLTVACWWWQGCFVKPSKLEEQQSKEDGEEDQGKHVVLQHFDCST